MCSKIIIIKQLSNKHFLSVSWNNWNIRRLIDCNLRLSGLIITKYRILSYQNIITFSCCCHSPIRNISHLQISCYFLHTWTNIISFHIISSSNQSISTPQYRLYLCQYSTTIWIFLYNSSHSLSSQTLIISCPI